MPELPIRVSAGTGAARPRTTDSGAAKYYFSGWGAEVEPCRAKTYAMISPIRSATISIFRSGSLERTYRAPKSSAHREVAQEAVYARLAHTLAVEEDPLIFRYRENKSPWAGSRIAVGRKRPRVSLPTTHATDFRWHHRKAHPIRELFCRAPALQSEFLRSGGSEQQVGRQAAGVRHRSCRLEPLPVKEKILSYF
jgi:hypothetical protein